MLKGGMAITVVGGALIPVLQNLVGFVDFLELEFAGLVARIAVGVPLHRQLAKGRLEPVFVRVPIDFQSFVVAALGRHQSNPPELQSFIPKHHSKDAGLGLMKNDPQPSRRRAPWHEGHGGLRSYADFLFLSSSTSVNSASTTSSLAAPFAASPSACCLYIASPSFIEACASVLVLALIASASSPFSASFRSLTASSMARRSVSAIFEPCSASAFSVECTSASA